jgi:hypothetical protein
LKIETLQRELEDLYRLPPADSVGRFLVTSREIREYVPGDAGPGPQVLIQEARGEIRLAVHLGEEILRRLGQAREGEPDLADFLSAAEEVSHFLYLVWSVGNRRPVTLLDVEMQGEIDKFLLASLHFRDEPALFQRIFHGARVDAALTASLRRRYEEATRLGWRFCRAWRERVSVSHALHRALEWLRRFYRMNSRARLAHVMCL